MKSLTTAAVLKPLREDQTVATDDFLRVAVEKLHTNRTGCVCVVDPNGRLIGVITDGDLRRVLFRSGGNTLAEIFVMPALRIATKSPRTIPRSTPLQEALALMHKHYIGALPVVEEGYLQGIINMQDILEHLVLQEE